MLLAKRKNLNMKISQDRIRQIIKEEVNHSHAESDQGVRVKRHLNRIGKLVHEMIPVFEDDDGEEEAPRWIQEKIAVVAAMLQTILDYKNEEEIRSK